MTFPRFLCKAWWLLHRQAFGTYILRECLKCVIGTPWDSGSVTGLLRSVLLPLLFPSASDSYWIGFQDY